MSADWKAGDRALCVRDDNGLHFDFLTNKRILEGPVLGRVYLVSVVEYHHGLVWLGIDSIDTGGCWEAEVFRRIVPACDRISQEQEAVQ